MRASGAAESSAAALSPSAVNWYEPAAFSYSEGRRLSWLIVIPRSAIFATACLQ